jgi:hypothetical protein
MAGSPRSIELSVRIYKMLIKAYPVSFRREYKNEMTLVFREHITDVLQKRGTFGLVTAWFRLLGDLVWSAPKEHFREMQRRIAMKNTALALLSVFLAAIAYSVMLFGMAFIGLFPILVDINHIDRELFTLPVVIYISAFLSGLILTRVKPFFMPVVTVPLGTMAIGTLWALDDLVGAFHQGTALGWSALIVPMSFVASLGLASFLGCFVATKASNHLVKFSVPWFQLAGSLAVLICTSMVASVLRVVVLAGNLLVSDLILRRVLVFCLYALLLIAAITIANIIILVVRTYQKAKVQ